MCVCFSNMTQTRSFLGNVTLCQDSGSQILLLNAEVNLMPQLFYECEEIWMQAA